MWNVSEWAPDRGLAIGNRQVQTTRSPFLCCPFLGGLFLCYDVPERWTQNEERKKGPAGGTPRTSDRLEPFCHFLRRPFY